MDNLSNNGNANSPSTAVGGDLKVNSDDHVVAENSTEQPDAEEGSIWNSLQDTRLIQSFKSSSVPPRSRDIPGLDTPDNSQQDTTIQQQHNNTKSIGIVLSGNPFFKNLPPPDIHRVAPGASPESETMKRIIVNNPIASSGPGMGISAQFSNPKYSRNRNFGRNKGRCDRRWLSDKGSVVEKFVEFVPADSLKTVNDESDEVHYLSDQAVSVEGGFIKPVEKMEKSKKRTHDGLGFSGGLIDSKKLKVTPEKPAASILNELNPGLEYIYEDIKPSPQSQPRFSCKVMYPVEGQTPKEFIGIARSKKLAKQSVAEIILRDIGILKEDSTTKIELSGNNIVIIPNEDVKMAPVEHFKMPDVPELAPLPTSNANIDFTTDDLNPEFHVINNYLYKPQFDISTSAKRLRKVPDLANNSLCALNSLIGSEFEFEEVSVEGPPHEKKFTYNLKLKMNGLTFQGVGCNIKKAKGDASKKALISLLGPNTYQHLISTASSKKPASFPTSNLIASPEESPSNLPNLPTEFFNEDLNYTEYDIMFSDYICRIVNEKYEALMQENSNYLSQKVLAGVVMTRTVPMLENGEVIAITTGTKTIDGDFMSQDGLSLNDCHAEILATRCVRDFIYTQLEDLIYASSDEEIQQSIFTSIKSEDNGEILYKVKDSIKFHLYISTSPCGDARIFSPKGLETEEEKIAIGELEDSHSSRRNRGVLRAKIEAGEGTIPVANLITGPQTWDSIVSGNALYTMSCSDKVCRWNVVGLQGALLSNLINPVYYSSLTLGSLHHPVHFKRAVYGRVEELAGKLPLPFKINRAHLLMVSHEEKRHVKKSPNHAVCWALGWSTPEILGASKGRCEPGGVASRLAKRMAFIRFLKLYKNKSGRRDGFAGLSYREAKNMAINYQISNTAFRSHMNKSGWGTWISKPIEMDSFNITK